jgi:ATP-dependent DNA helicase RecG
MSSSFLETPVEYLKGVGPQRAELLKTELGVFTFGDLITWYPFRYVDRTRFYKVSEITADLPYVQLRGRIVKAQMMGEKRGKRLTATFQDDTGTLELVWFQGAKWVLDKIKPGIEYIVFGKPAMFNGRFNIAHPELDLASDEKVQVASALQAVYPTTEKLKAKGLDSKGLGKLIRTLAVMLDGHIPETIPHTLLHELHLMPREQAFRQIHIPDNPTQLKKAETRLKFEELFFVQVKLLRTMVSRKQQFQGFSFPVIGDHFNSFFNHHLEFQLTGAQKRVIREIRLDMGSGRQMNRLLQGDVGSGKTLVALMVMLIALDNGYQSCIMAPTEILATQHFATISSFLKDMDITVGLLTGSTKTAQRRILHERLLAADLDILIGTHALLEDEVRFKNLGLVVIDEQHRFGVAQRARLWKKNVRPPHVLVMTATPIPRTLAMTLYGDLDTSVIDEMPPGRKPIQTVHRYDSQRLPVFEFMKQQIQLGRQVYVVYPLIQESEKMDYKDLMDGYESIVRAFPMPQYRVSIVHGKMKAQDKEHEMQRFVKGETQIMVATTVIEVGVNVPNASVMVIESAERFGLSQLHQLRGRVGRGADQSYCILMTGNKLGSEARLRIDTMCRTNDGFEIAEADLRLRGPGDLTGTQQSGLVNLRIADLAKDQQLLQLARDHAMKLLESDPNLEKPEHSAIVRALAKLENQQNTNWSRIS